ncbi:MULTISPECIES: WXG100 family type VII secretion target [unclassified Streptomyces]|uniref:WXG100 family type VII secretion target n=1 Tax=unclassified Streptomyces TaxID=2593676 RepID=UPI001489C4D7|nr:MULTISPECIES: WXG100 family type VII secretion target [unclassified Streptomyces]
MTDEQHKADLERVSNQNSFADIARNVEHLPGRSFFTQLVTDPLRAAVGSTAPGKAVFVSTDFAAKDLDLNAMIDLVEEADPEDLESSGRALWEARSAIKSAADELRGRIDNVRWVGEAGNAFREWGASLVTSTTDLSEYAGKAGDQLSAAAMGLASVRKAMPARDPMNLKRPEGFTDAEKAAKKEDYDAAVKVEKDRQEAINQMNRLASYYAVSSQQLAVLQENPPTFRPMPNIGMPPASMPGAESVGAGSGNQRAAAAYYHARVESQGRSGVPDVSDTPTSSSSVTGKVTYPDNPVGTTIDSVGTLPPSTTTPATGHTPPVTGTPPQVSGQPGMFHSLGPSIPSKASGRTTGATSGPRTPTFGHGRTNPGLTNPATGRTTGPGATNQIGRPTATGQPVARGNGSGSKPFPMGQPGVSGGTPRPGGATGPRATVGPTTGAGRANGVVGGRPMTTGGATAKDGPRIPRGTVIGTGPTANPRPPTGGARQRGVFGAPSPSSARSGAGAGAASRSGATGGSKPVIGRPTGRNSSVQAERNGMTRGGSGLVRRPGGKGSPDEGDPQGTQRPRDVVEDEETHLPNNSRRHVPPAVN